MLPIKPHLWFNKYEAKEAAEFYVSLLPGSEVNFTGRFSTGHGHCDVIEFNVAGQPFLGISDGGESFKFNPSISFMINFDPSRDQDAARHLDDVWHKLTEGGQVMMPLDRYPFSERFGWVADKYGLSWQLILTNPSGEPRPVIIPAMMFTGGVAGKAEEAVDFYCGVFKDGKRGNTVRYPPDSTPDKEGTVMFADFYIDGAWIAAMDSAHPHGFGFNEALSLLIPCETQEEIDYYWQALTAGGKPGQCGWLKDRFGVSWQVASTVMANALENGAQEQIDRVVQAFMPMSKVDAAILKKAYEGQ